MHSNKKTLTSRNSPWLLCPSKSFPGKFYYFNGSTGETAWSLNDADTRNLKKATICTVADKTHSYPEPLGPPLEDSNTSSSVRRDPLYTDKFRNNTLRNNGFGNILNIRKSFNTNQNISTDTNFSHLSSSGINFGHQTNPGHGSHFFDNIRNKCPAPSPVFGQAVFPKYVPETAVPKVIWALTPMLIPEVPTQKRMLDQVTQYEPQEVFLSVPLTNRFRNLENPFQLNTSFHQEVPMFDQILAQRVNVKKTFDPKPKTKDEGSQTLPKAKIRTPSLSQSTPKTILKPSPSVENFKTISHDKSSGPKTEVDDSSNMDKLRGLKENDLRLLLIAKKRQSVNLCDTPKSTKEPAKPKTLLGDVTTRKRVTFALDDASTSSDRVQSDDALSPDSLEMECTEPSVNISEAGNIWYIAVDWTVLLAGFECVEQFVLSDKNRRLLIPYVVKIKIESLSKSDCMGRHNNITARQLIWKLATPNTHIVVQRKPETVSASEEDAILKCCWQLLQENQVVLITDNTKLYEKAKIIDIECHTFDEFKNAIKPIEMQDTFDWKKVKITIKNDDKPTGNLFQQTLEELNPFSLSQSVDYPVRTLFDNQRADIGRVVFGKRDDNDKLIDLTNTHKDLKRLCHDVDEIDQDISRLKITEQMTRRNQNRRDIVDVDDDDDDDIENRNQNPSCQFKNGRETIKISGITKLDSVFDLDDELRRFYIKSDAMENRVKSRRDEWICRLTQIMEEALTAFLLKEKVKFKKIPPPWSLSEAIQIIGEKLKNQSKIRTVAERFNAHLFNCSSNIGKLNQNMKPIDIIKMVGFSMILLQNLKETIDYIDFNEADDRLSELIKNIEDPKTDIEFNLESIITPVLRRTDEKESRTPMSYTQKQAEVLEYLKKHYAAMQNYELEKGPKILRLTGRDLNTLKINRDKDVTIEKNEIKEKVEPKVIRNVKVIEAYEEKLKLNIDLLDYDNTLVTISSEHDDFPDDKMARISSDETLKINDFSECSVPEATLRSTLQEECIQACPLMKTFITELRRTFMRIFTFVSESMQDYQNRELYEDKRADINIKADMAHKYMLKIVERLQSIVARESGNGPTLKDLITQAGDYVEDDETMARYKDVVTRYLEQAQILEEALKILLTLTKEI